MSRLRASPLSRLIAAVIETTGASTDLWFWVGSINIGLTVLKRLPLSTDVLTVTAPARSASVRLSVGAA